MPLARGYSRAAISKNIRELARANKKRKKKRSRKQIIAIALSTARLYAMRAGRKPRWLNRRKKITHRRKAR